MGFITKSNVTGTGNGADTGSAGVLLKGGKAGTANLGAGFAPSNASRAYLHFAVSGYTQGGSETGQYLQVTCNRTDINNSNINTGSNYGQAKFEGVIAGTALGSTFRNKVTLKYGDSNSTVTQDKWMVYSGVDGDSEEGLFWIYRDNGPLAFAGQNPAWDGVKYTVGVNGADSNWEGAGQVTFSGRTAIHSGSTVSPNAEASNNLYVVLSAITWTTS